MPVPLLTHPLPLVGPRLNTRVRRDIPTLMVTSNEPVNVTEHGVETNQRAILSVRWESPCLNNFHKVMLPLNNITSISENGFLLLIAVITLMWEPWMFKDALLIWLLTLTYYKKHGQINLTGLQNTFEEAARYNQLLMLFSEMHLLIVIISSSVLMLLVYTNLF